MNFLLERAFTKGDCIGGIGRRCDNAALKTAQKHRMEIVHTDEILLFVTIKLRLTAPYSTVQSLTEPYGHLWSVMETTEHLIDKNKN